MQKFYPLPHPHLPALSGAGAGWAVWVKIRYPKKAVWFFMERVRVRVRFSGSWVTPLTEGKTASHFRCKIPVQLIFPEIETIGLEM